VNRRGKKGRVKSVGRRRGMFLDRQNIPIIFFFFKKNFFFFTFNDPKTIKTSGGVKTLSKRNKCVGNPSKERRRRKKNQLEVFVSFSF
jgi:hypothetical protein